MLELSGAVVASFAQNARASAEAELRAMLIGRDPRLASDSSLPARINQLVTWAETQGVTSRLDIETMAEMTFIRGLDLSRDDDFRTALQTGPEPRDCVMLHYLERKAPGFWTDRP